MQKPKAAIVATKATRRVERACRGTCRARVHSLPRDWRPPPPGGTAHFRSCRALRSTTRRRRARRRTRGCPRSHPSGRGAQQVRRPRHGRLLRCPTARTRAFRARVCGAEPTGGKAPRPNLRRRSRRLRWVDAGLRSRSWSQNRTRRRLAGLDRVPPLAFVPQAKTVPPAKAAEHPCIGSCSVGPQKDEARGTKRRTKGRASLQTSPDVCATNGPCSPALWHVSRTCVTYALRSENTRYIGAGSHFAELTGGLQRAVALRWPEMRADLLALYPSRRIDGRSRCLQSSRAIAEAIVKNLSASLDRWLLVGLRQVANTCLGPCSSLASLVAPASGQSCDFRER